MDVTPQLDTAYRPSDDVVAREIEGQLIIVPIAAGVGDMEDELYSLNDPGRAIWARLDGTRSLQQIVDELSAEYEAAPGEIERDVTGLVAELLQRRMLEAVGDA
jgi:Coenzyme PQQ synthesis protein D (PqqD)